MDRGTRRFMQVLIRADASKVIGTGHVMRCLVLADRLAETGATCTFVSRNFEGHLAHAVEARGHRCTLLDRDADATPGAGYDQCAPDHAHWLGSNWRHDANETIGIARAIGDVSLTVVDHYALDHRWQGQVKPYAGRLIVLDDLTDRRHCADVVINQNYGHDPDLYADLVADDCRILAGPQYALLRPQFAALRPQALARRKKIGHKRRLLVFLGGGDTDRPLGRVTNTLLKCQIEHLSAITIITGRTPIADTVAGQLRTGFDVPVEVLHQVEDMASVILRSDLAIGGGGITNWERCALGLPTLIVTIGENQKAINSRLAQDGIIFACVEPDDLDPQLLTRFLTMNEATYHTISNRAANVTDGHGADRIMETLQNDAI